MGWPQLSSEPHVVVCHMCTNFVLVRIGFDTHIPCVQIHWSIFLMMTFDSQIGTTLVTYDDMQRGLSMKCILLISTYTMMSVSHGRVYRSCAYQHVVECVGRGVGHCFSFVLF